MPHDVNKPHIALEHYSHLPDLTEIDPHKIGTGTGGMDMKRAIPETPVSYYYRAGSEPEDVVKGRSSHKYIVNLHPEHKLYDMADGDIANRLLASGKTFNPGIVTRDEHIKAIKEAGYHGFYNSASALPHAVALFYAHKPDSSVHLKVSKNEPNVHLKLSKAPLIFDAEDSGDHMDVWRMQNSAGEGPYRGIGMNGGATWWDKSHDFTKQRPMPHQDTGFDEDERQMFDRLSLGYDPEGKHFGFKTLEHLNRWFSPSEREKLAALGYKPTKVKAKKVWTSKKQAFFEPHDKAAQKYKKLAASEDLEKGVMSRIAPFSLSPNDEDSDVHDQMKDWQEGERQSSRDWLTQQGMEPNARTRALHRLTGHTPFRVNKNGEREFLLHRGMSRGEYVDSRDSSIDGKKKFINQYYGSTSWTPHYGPARAFAFKYEDVWRPKSSGVVSAWINENDIGFVPMQYGAHNQRAPNDFKDEYEVIVNPKHRSEMVKQADALKLMGKRIDSRDMVVPQAYNIDQQINQRGGKSIYPHAGGYQLQQHRNQIKDYRKQASAAAPKKLAASEDLEKGQNGHWDKEGYTLEPSFSHDRNELIISTKAPDGSEAARHAFTKPHKDSHWIHVDDSFVLPRHQRKGITSAAYKMAEEHLGGKLRPIASEQSPAAKALWSNPYRQFGKSENDEPTSSKDYQDFLGEYGLHKSQFVDIQSLPIGHHDPERQREVQWLMPNYKSWFADKNLARKHDNFVANNAHQIVDMAPASHKDTVSKFLSTIQNDPKRHAIAGYHIENGQEKWTPRIRHIKSLLFNDPNVSMNYNPDGSINFNLHVRHGKSQAGTSWNFHPEKGLQLIKRG